MTFFRKLLATNAPAAVILVRLLVGGVFLSEGIQKFLYPDALGVGRGDTVDFPVPALPVPRAHRPPHPSQCGRSCQGRPTNPGTPSGVPPIRFSRTDGRGRPRPGPSGGPEPTGGAAAPLTFSESLSAM